MANEISPDLNTRPPAWYHGLTRYQWWVLIIATMGWMFDTMDQQFFNLGRGPAMNEVLGLEPVAPGLKQLGKHQRLSYTAGELEELVSAGVLTAQEKTKVLSDRQGQRRDRVTRMDVARVVGEALVAAKHIELGQARLAEAGVTATTLDEAALDDLVAKNVVSAEAAEAQRARFPSGQIPRQELALHLGKEIAKVQADKAGDNATFIFVMGWAVGGLFLGGGGDALGRAKTMALTILCYALFTGLNGLAQTQMQFNVLRFLTALGVGGEFAAGAALVAETMPDRSRPAALGALQALSALGNMTAAALAFFIMPVWGWRWLFAIGALPGLVAVFVFLGLKEPEKWKQARAKWLEDKTTGVATARASYVGLFQDPRWRKRAIVGLLLGVVGVGGLWGVGFFTPELNRSIAKAYSEEAREKLVSKAFFLQQFGAVLGIWAYTFVALRIGRRPAFALFFVLAFFVVSYTFLFADTIWEAYALAMPVGFVTLGLFGGYAIYFPELFPTRLRATGVGFCYNVGRFLAALVPSLKSGLKGMFMSGAVVLPFLPSAVQNAERAIRYGSFIMIFVYILGLIVLLFAPETKDQPLPED